MIHYTKNEPVGKPAWYTVVAANGVCIGSLEQEVDGYYYFYPVARGGFWESFTMKDVANKLEALNEAWHQKLTKELGCPEEACTEFTPNHPFTD